MTAYQYVGTTLSTGLTISGSLIASSSAVDFMEQLQLVVLHLVVLLVEMVLD